MKLSELKVGDTVIMSHGRSNAYSVQVVTRVTATQIIVSNMKFNPNSGWQKGKFSAWDTGYCIRVPIDGEIEEVHQANEVKRLRSEILNRIASTSFSKMTTDQLIAVNAAIPVI